MKHETQVELLEACLALARDKASYQTHGERLVPVAEYADPARFDRERELVLRPALNVVAHASQLPSPRSFLTLDLHGRPVLLVRDESGAPRAFLNVCRHRGATVEPRASGQCKGRFVCPYHAWTYGTDGALKSVRFQDGFPTLERATSGLVELACQEAGGLLWVSAAPGTPPAVAAGSKEALDELESLGMAECEVFATTRKVWKGNWKLIVDGGLESYHFKIAHRQTVGPFFVDNGSTWQPLGDHLRSVLPRREIRDLAGRPKREWDIRAASHVLYSLFPNASVLVQERHFELILIAPLSPTETLVELSTVVPTPTGALSDQDRAFYTANHAFTKKTLYEDFELAEQIQRGVDSGANTHFRFASFEGALTHWHDQIDRVIARRSAAAYEGAPS